MANRFLELLNQIKTLTGLNFGIGYVTLALVGGTVIFALLWLTLASILPVEEYGKISYLLAISLIGAMFSNFGLRITMLTFLPKGIKELRNQINSFLLISSISIAGVTLLIFQSIPIFILIITTVFFIMSTAECIANKKYKEYTILVIGGQSTQALLTLIFYNTGGIEFALIGYGIGSIPFSYRYFSSLRFFKFRFNEIRSRFRSVVHGFSLMMARNVQWYDKLLIAPLFGFFILGQYQIGIQFLLFLGVIPRILFDFLLPEKAIGISHTRIRYTSVIITIVFVVILWFVTPSIISNLFPKYVESIFTTQIILIGAIPLTINSLLDTKLLGLGESKYVFYGVLFYIGILTLSILTLGLAYSTIGLGISIVLALSSQASFLLLVDHFVIRKKTKNPKEK